MTRNTTDTRWMALALSLGRRSMGQTWPNPAVGCVVVNKGRVVGRGWTAPGGRPHAEAQALASAGQQAQGATAYVTLEPCAHHGQSPPCAEALVRAGIARVVTAIEDPDPRVAGKGHARLREAGIQVETGCLQDRARADHAGFLSRQQTGKPFVTLKLAASFDGRIATKSGESQWITGPHARRHVHWLRATHDAVMVGSGTTRADDPMLTVRNLGPRRQPARIICDTTLSTPVDSQLANSTHLSPVWLCHGPTAPAPAKDAWAARGASLLECRMRDGRLDIEDALTQCASQGITRLFCEGGGKLAASLLANDLADQLIGFTAGLTLGAEALPSVAPLPLQALADYPRFDLVETRVLGKDLMHRWLKAT